MKPLYANVVINSKHKSLDKIFQYSIPKHLQKEISKGKMVLVPFGKTLAYGYVVELSSSQGHPTLKDVLGVLPEETSLNEEALSLSEWIADYYLTTKAAALRLFVPGGFLPGFSRQFQIQKKRLTDKKEHGNIATLLGHEKIDSTTWFEYKAVSQNSEFNKARYQDLIDNGCILERYQLVENVSMKDWSKVRMRILPKGALESNEYNSLNKKAPRQFQLLNHIHENRNSSAFDLLRATRISSSVLLRLQEKELIELYEEVEEKAKGAPGIELNNEQNLAWQAILGSLQKEKYEPLLLFGVTGSGKTEVYMKVMEACLARNKQVIYILPEIFLTMQILKRIEERFPNDTVVLHSQLTEKQRYEAWQSIKVGEKKIIIGARSAVFAPLSRIGAIIIDEEHDQSFKQENEPRYHAKEVAIKRAQWHQCPVVFGSATPSVETYLAAVKGRIRLLRLDYRINNQDLPHVDIVDMRDDLRNGNVGIFSHLLQDKIHNTIAQGRQAILYLNRRGFASFMLCRECGFVSTCKNCDVSLTYHSDVELLLCHYCGHKQPLVFACPNCQSKNWKPYGFGTQRIEQELMQLFPKVSYVRIDGDVAAKKKLVTQHMLDFASGKAQVMIGTQMVAKGLDFPQVTLVGVLSADTTLSIPDFRSRERSFQLLTQVLGRAGRGQWPGEAIIQTFNPNELSIQCAKEQNYERFFDEEITFRKEFSYPPFSQIVRAVFTGSDEALVGKSAAEFYKKCSEEIKREGFVKFLEILGPSPCGLAKIKGEYRYQLLIKHRRDIPIRPILRKAMDWFYHETKAAKKVYLTIDINPNHYA